MPDLSLSQASALIDAVFAEAAARGLPPLAAAVLDSGGHLKAMQRQDNLSFLRAQVCQAKAWGALGLGTDSARLAERFESDARQRGFMMALNAMSGGGVVPLPGGVVVRDPDGTVLGALGVAGAASEEDEACALAAVRALGLVAGNA